MLVSLFCVLQTWRGCVDCYMWRQKQWSDGHFGEWPPRQLESFFLTSEPELNMAKSHSDLHGAKPQIHWGWCWEVAPCSSPGSRLHNEHWNRFGSSIPSSYSCTGHTTLKWLLVSDVWTELPQEKYLSHWLMMYQSQLKQQKKHF